MWNSSGGIPSPSLALFTVMLPKAHLTSHSRMSGSRSVTTPSWLSGLLRPFLHSFSVYSCRLCLIFCFYFVYHWYFLYVWWCWTLFHVSVSHSYNSLVEYLFNRCSSCLNCVVILLLRCQYSLHVLDSSSLSDTWPANTSLPFCQLSFLWKLKPKFHSDKVQLINLFFCHLSFQCYI